MATRKLDLAQRIAKAKGLPLAQAKEIVQLVLDGMVEALAADGGLEHRCFGIFKVRRRKERVARNPRTGAQVMVPPRKQIPFKPAKTMVERVVKEPRG